MGKLVLVTGGAGFVGTRLVPLLLEKKYKVKVLDNLMYNQIVLLDYFINPDFEFIKGDITDEENMKIALKGVDFIIHLAGIAGTPICDKNPELAKKVNVNGTEIINRLRGKIPIIFTSSECVYGKQEKVCTEMSTINPLSLYSKTKAESEKIIINSGNYIVFRPVSAFGMSQRMRVDLLLNDFVYRALKDKKLIVFEKDARRTLIHASDFAKALVFALENFNEMKNEIYNLGSEENLTKKEIAELIKEYQEYYLQFAEFNKDPDKKNYKFSIKKLKDKGFLAHVPVREGIKELIRGYQEI